jgi:glycine dehydrogenase subunit 1
MLDEIGVADVADLFSDIPSDILLEGGIELAGHRSEFEVYNRLKAAADKNVVGVSFLGSGVYDHLIPSIVPFITSRSEFVTAYTPYQAEMSQGILQAIFEYQSLVCALTSLDVSNASLYDGATAAAEACAMAVNSYRGKGGAGKGAGQGTGGRCLLYSTTLYPHTIEVLKTFFSDIEIELVGIEPSNGGALSLDDLAEHLDDGAVGVIVQSPNRYGCIEDYTGFADAAHGVGAKLIISANPISLGILKSPGEWNADIAVGDGQSCGLDQNYGGPGVGYICATGELMRRMPGRIVGESEDVDGNRAFVLTLQAREQHIKRERATSNICTNQALAALAVAVYLTSLGPVGVSEVARQSHSKAKYLHERLLADTPAEPLFEEPFFNEFVLRLPMKAESVVEKLTDEGYLPGLPIAEHDLLVAVTEKRPRDELDRYIALMQKVLV